MSMTFHLMSDIHLEFGPLHLDESRDVGDAVLLVAGDYGMVTQRSHVEYMKHLAARYRRVLHTAGNHEYYGGRIDKVDRMWRELELEVPNYRYLNPGQTTIDDVLVLGASLWTDIHQSNPLDMYHVELSINDYKKITVKDGNNYRKLRARDTTTINRTHRNYLSDRLAEVRNRSDIRAVVVMTHHAPLDVCVAPEHRNDYPTNYAYHNTRMEDWFTDDIRIDAWVHGHTHHPYTETVGRTRLICHPRGYVGFESTAVGYRPLEFTL